MDQEELEEGSTSELVAEAIRAHGDKVNMGQGECVLRKSKHPINPCRGCASELGCGKTIAILLVSLQASSYTPRGIEDHFRSYDVVGGVMGKIMDAQSLEEVAQLRDHPFGG